MILLVCHSCGTLSTYTVHLKELIIHEAKKEGHGAFSRAAFCPGVGKEGILKLLKKGNVEVRNVVLLQFDFALTSCK